MCVHCQCCRTRVLEPKRVRLESRFSGLGLGLGLESVRTRTWTRTRTVGTRTRAPSPHRVPFFPIVADSPAEFQLKFSCQLCSQLSLTLFRLTYRILPTSFDNYHCTNKYETINKPIIQFCSAAKYKKVRATLEQFRARMRHCLAAESH